MRSPILVDAALNYEDRGDHIHITDEGGAIHLALPRSSFYANLEEAIAFARTLCQPEPCQVIRFGRGDRH